MKKKKNNFFSILSEKKLALINTLIFALTALILYFVLPMVLNYPPNSIDNAFQIKIVGITYTTQFLILISILLVLLYIALRILYSKISLKQVDKNNLSKEQIHIIRKKCSNYPYLMLLLEIFIPVILVGILLFFFNTEAELIFRICIVVFSFSAIFAILSYMISKDFFVNILIETSKLVDNKEEGIRLQLYNKLFIQILPLFLYSFVIILLLSTTLMTTEKGELLYHFYRQELLGTFDSNAIYTIDEITNQLDTLEMKSTDDHTLIMNATTGEVLHSKNKLNDFFINYTLEFYDKTDGYTYEYYGQNIEGSVIKLHTVDGDVFVGIRYYVFGNNFIIPFFIVAAILITFNLLFVLYIGKDISNDIKHIIKGMRLISNTNDIANAGNLPITSNDEIGDLTDSFNQIQDLTKDYLHQIHDKQDLLMEKERLASLGQLIGGIAHNLKTPIMSISGASEGLTDLVKEYDASIEDVEVTQEDHHAIAADMNKWIEKIKTHASYMSDIITVVKGQAVTLSEEDQDRFTLEELIKRVNILMKHELKNALIDLNVHMNMDCSVLLTGNVNSLVQVINNMISNSIQAYSGKTNQAIDITLSQNNNKVIISIQDYGAGMTKEVKEKLFKEMITTKGKNGTGLGLFMSYSTIRAHFNGTITFESESGKGTKFDIILPL